MFLIFLKTNNQFQVQRESEKEITDFFFKNIFHIFFFSFIKQLIFILCDPTKMNSVLTIEQ